MNTTNSSRTPATAVAPAGERPIMFEVREIIAAGRKCRISAESYVDVKATRVSPVSLLITACALLSVAAGLAMGWFVMALLALGWAVVGVDGCRRAKPRYIVTILNAPEQGQEFVSNDSELATRYVLDLTHAISALRSPNSTLDQPMDTTTLEPSAMSRANKAC